MHTDPCDAEEVMTREELQQEARDMAIRLEAEQAEAAVIDEDKRRYAEWIIEHQEGQRGAA